MKVQITGYPKVYERFGKFSLNVETVELVGEGALARSYILLKKKLADEGLFDESRKRLIPRFPERIGLITSAEAAAYGDFLRILNNRWSGVEVIHIPVHVQGQHAVPEILAAFEQFEQLPVVERPEVIVLTRGGGSLEDLHAFNDESVARAVFQSSMPVICGVGHERDESLCDFVADIRASTPSNAAERIVPSRHEIGREIEISIDRMGDTMGIIVERREQRINHATSVLQRYIEQKMHDLKMTVERFTYAFDRFRLALVETRKHIERSIGMIEQIFSFILSKLRGETDSLVRLFASFDMQKVLQRGFSIVRKNNKIVRAALELAPGDTIQVQLGAGEFEADIK
ncbi:exodeoxyribonuclease VII large subunit, partial [Patescibacteria group bacterium]|nr:exodeoxyribonuclease VII large subunit [Patescibacteria group bacterium]